MDEEYEAWYHLVFWKGEGGGKRKAKQASKAGNPLRNEGKKGWFVVDC